MRSILIFLALSFSAGAFANVGFTCPKLKREIAREVQGGILTLVVRNTENRTTMVNGNLILDPAQTTDAYQDRYGTYYTVMEAAQLSFPYMPETLLVIHLGRSGNLYKKGFRAFEGQGGPVELSNLYCKAFIAGIEKY